MGLNRTLSGGQNRFTLYPRGQPRVSDFAHAVSADHARLPTLQIELERNPLPRFGYAIQFDPKDQSTRRNILE
jgi:hypothetical protein